MIDHHASIFPLRISPFPCLLCNNEKNALGNDPLQKNHRVNAPAYHAVHLAPLHSALRIPSHRFIKDGIAETLGFVNDETPTMVFRATSSNFQQALRIYPVFYHNLIKAIEETTACPILTFLTAREF